MVNMLVIIAAAVLLILLLFFEKKEHQLGKLTTKTPLSLLFILAAVLQPQSTSGYHWFLISGLTFCLAGDVLLVFSSSRTFLFGLVAFLVGHLCYASGFFFISRISWMFWVVTVLVVIVSAKIFYWLKPYLGSMTVPVLLYIVIINGMVMGAAAVFFDKGLQVGGRSLVFVGAILFYLSDLFVARDRFRQHGFANRLVGLPLYYAGQFLLAFSAGAF